MDDPAGGPDGAITDPSGSPVRGFGNFNAPVSGNGEQIPLFDGNGNPIPTDGNGNVRLPLDGNGNPLPVFDENGNRVSLDRPGIVSPLSDGFGGSNIPNIDDAGDFPLGGRDEEDLKNLLNGGNGNTNQQPNGLSEIPDFSGLTGRDSNIPVGGNGLSNLPSDIGDLLNGNELLNGGDNGGATAGGIADFPLGGNGSGTASDGLGSGSGSDMPGSAIGGDGPGSGFGGEGWSDWSGQSQNNQDGNGSGNSGGGHAPFMPPMMPPIMPPQGGQGNKDRERQTWLSEDEKVWGTSGNAVGGVIGGMNGPEVENEEQPAPTHVHVRSTAPGNKEREDNTRVQSTQQSSEGKQ